MRRAHTKAVLSTRAPGSFPGRLTKKDTHCGGPGVAVATFVCRTAMAVEETETVEEAVLVVIDDSTAVNDDVPPRTVPVLEAVAEEEGEAVAALEGVLVEDAVFVAEDMDEEEPVQDADAELVDDTVTVAV